MLSGLQSPSVLVVVFDLPALECLDQVPALLEQLDVAASSTRTAAAATATAAASDADAQGLASPVKQVSRHIASQSFPARMTS